MRRFVKIKDCGVPATGLSPVFTVLKTSVNGTSKLATKPTIYELTAGIYYYDITYGVSPWDTTSEDLVGTIDCGSSLMDIDRYKNVTITKQELSNLVTALSITSEAANPLALLSYQAIIISNQTTAATNISTLLSNDTSMMSSLSSISTTTGTINTNVGTILTNTSTIITNVGIIDTNVDTLITNLSTISSNLAIVDNISDTILDYIRCDTEIVEDVNGHYIKNYLIKGTNTVLTTKSLFDISNDNIISFAIPIASEKEV